MSSDVHAEYGRGFNMGRAAAAWAKDKVGCLVDTAEAFNDPEVAKTLATMAAGLISEGQTEGQLSTSESVDGFKDGFFRETIALCVGKTSEPNARREPQEQAQDEALGTAFHRELADDFLRRLDGVRGLSALRPNPSATSFFIRGASRNLWCRFFPFGDEFLTVSVRIPLLMHEVSRTKELVERMLDLNASLGLGAIVLDPDNKLALDYTFVVNSISVRDTMAIISFLEHASEQLGEEFSRLTGAMAAFD